VLSVENVSVKRFFRAVSTVLLLLLLLAFCHNCRFGRFADLGDSFDGMKLDGEQWEAAGMLAYKSK
jgi:hypothetical protein